jgi:hypothetical protein
MCHISYKEFMPTKMDIILDKGSKYGMGKWGIVWKSDCKFELPIIIKTKSQKPKKQESTKE